MWYLAICVFLMYLYFLKCKREISVLAEYFPFKKIFSNPRKKPVLQN